MVIGDHQPHAGQATLLEATQELGPERTGLDLADIQQLAHERLRQLAMLKLPELDDLIARATSVRRVLKICSPCSCESIEVCRMFDERVLPLRDHTATSEASRARRRALPTT